MIINPYIFGVIATSYLLDLYPAPVAYSLRKLSSSATLSIRVRRSSDNTEQDIGFSGDDLDTTSLASFVGANSAYITKKYNQGSTGSVDDAIQTTAASQPRIVNAGVLDVENTKPTIVYSGTQSLVIPSTVYNGKGRASVISVFNPLLANSYEMIYTHSDGFGAAGRIELRRNITNDKLEYFFYSNVGGTVGTNVINSQQNIVGMYGGNSITCNFYLNNTLDGTHTAPTALLGNYPSKIGQRVSSYGFVGNVQELILYTTNEVSNRTDIETNINDYYGIY